MGVATPRTVGRALRNLLPLLVDSSARLQCSRIRIPVATGRGVPARAMDRDLAAESGILGVPDVRRLLHAENRSRPGQWIPHRARLSGRVGRPDAARQNDAQAAAAPRAALLSHLDASVL